MINYDLDEMWERQHYGGLNGFQPRGSHPYQADDVFGKRLASGPVVRVYVPLCSEQGFEYVHSWTLVIRASA